MSDKHDRVYNNNSNVSIRGIRHALHKFTTYLLTYKAQTVSKAE